MARKRGVGRRSAERPVSRSNKRTRGHAKSAKEPGHLTRRVDVLSHAPAGPEILATSMSESSSDDRILNALRQRIEGDGDSARRVARFLSVHTAVVLDWLSGARRPRRATLERIDAFLRSPAVNRWPR